jgi:hypothetical protein
MKHSPFFTARLIAQVANVHMRTIKRHAVKQGWQWRMRGNTLQFIPPPALQAKCLAASHEVKAAGLNGFTIGASKRAEIFRANLRFAALAALDTATKTEPFERALVRVARDFTFRASPSSLREWQKNFAKHGFDGLMEKKRGNVGRKPKAKNL